MQRNSVQEGEFNPVANLPFDLTTDEFSAAIQEVFDYFHEANEALVGKGLPRLETRLPGAGVSGMLTHMLTDSLASHSEGLVRNRKHNGFPSLIPAEKHVGDEAQSTTQGVSIKSTQNKSGRVDRHAGREAYHCVAVYDSPPGRSGPRITAVYLEYLHASDFKDSPRGRLGTRTSALTPAALERLRANWVYRIP